MLSNFLIEDETLWISTPTGSYDASRRFVKGYSAATTFEGLWEPFSTGLSTLVLPTGISSKESLILFTDLEINISDDHVGRIATASLVYLQDPVTFPNTVAYAVWDKASYISNGGFTLIGGFSEYILIRQEKLEN